MNILGRGFFVAGLLSLAIGTLFTMTSVVQAHERRNVQSYTFVVGWVTEPAYVNFANAVDLRISRTADGTPVTGQEMNLKAEITADGKKAEVTFRPRTNTPGAYDGRTFPTYIGDYSFRIFGNVEGNAVNETFTSGPNTFGSIIAPEGFPDPLPINQQLDESLNGLEQRIVNLESSDSGGDVGTAMAVGVAGVVIGLLGLGVGAFSLLRKAS